MRKLLALPALDLSSSYCVFPSKEMNRRVVHAAAVLKDVAESPDQNIPHEDQPRKDSQELLSEILEFLNP
jgi:hypothetical protein